MQSDLYSIDNARVLLEQARLPHQSTHAMEAHVREATVSRS
jgi:hypothetical protein